MERLSKKRKRGESKLFPSHGLKDKRSWLEILADRSGKKRKLSLAEIAKPRKEARLSLAELVRLRKKASLLSAKGKVGLNRWKAPGEKELPGLASKAKVPWTERILGRQKAGGSKYESLVHKMLEAGDKCLELD